MHVLEQYYYINALCTLCLSPLPKDFDIVSLLWARCRSHASFPPLPASDSFHKKAECIAFIKTLWILKGFNLSVCILGYSQPSLSAVRGVQRGEWSTVNHYCYSTDCTARPSICLPPSLTLPPPSQNAQIILSLDICLYCSLCPPTPVLFLSLTYKSLHTHTVSHREMLMITTSPPARQKRYLPWGQRGGGGTVGFWQEDSKFYCSLGDWGIQQAALVAQWLLAEIDLHSLICLLLQRLSRCWEEGGGCSPTGWCGPMSSCSW